MVDAATVKLVQQALNAQGFASPALTVDGNQGPLTTAALEAAQSAKGITVDGIIGPQTLSALGIATTTKTAAVAGAPAGKLKPADASSEIPGLRQSVIDALPDLFAQWEGKALPYMYTDSKGFVTTGTGNEIDSVIQAQALPWENADGSPASEADVQAAWSVVKSAYPGVQSTASQHLTTIRLGAAGLAQLMKQTMRANVGVLLGRYPSFAQWPADAQMAIMSKAWAWGAGGAWGSAADAALNASPPDFNKAAALLNQASVHEESINPGIVPRDRAETQMWANAAAAMKGGADFGKFFYPGGVVASLSLLALLYWFGGGALAVAGVLLWRRTRG